MPWTTRAPFHSIVFEKLALAAGYNLARGRSPTHPLFVSARPRWEARLRAMRPTWLGRRRSPYFNQHLVDAVTVIELARSGLQPREPGAVGHAADLVNDRLPRLLLARTAAGRTLASDGALSYQALTLGFYARAVQLLGSRAGPSAQALLGRLARASCALSGPDGDVAYFGRSQEQAWGLALTSYGAEVAAERAGQGRAARLRALSLRAIRRLRSVHAGGPHGLHLTPAFRSDPLAAIAESGGLRLGHRLHRADASRARLGQRPNRRRSHASGTRGHRREFERTCLTGARGGSRSGPPGGPGWRCASSDREPIYWRSRCGMASSWRDVLPHGAVAGGSNSGRPAALLRSRGRAAPRLSLAPCGVRIAGPASGRRWELSLFLPARSAAPAHGQTRGGGSADGRALPRRRAHRVRRAKPVPLLRPAR